MLTDIGEVEDVRIYNRTGICMNVEGKKIELTEYDKLRFSSDWFPPLISVDFLASV